MKKKNAQEKLKEERTYRCCSKVVVPHEDPGTI